nr:nitroreductase/quinone reductase family protein [Mycolicibacterium sp.]
MVVSIDAPYRCTPTNSSWRAIAAVTCLKRSCALRLHQGDEQIKARSTLRNPSCSSDSLNKSNEESVCHQRVRPISAVMATLAPTLGAKSGQPRQNPMAYQKSDNGDEIFVFASKNGKNTSSAWYHNVLAHPGDVAVEMSDGAFAVQVRELHGSERDRAYRIQAERFDNFAEYGKKTQRTIPVLGLTPTRS